MTDRSVHTDTIRRADYPIQYNRMMAYVARYHHKLIDSGYLEDLDEYVVRVVSPAFGRVVDVRLFDEVIQAYGEWQDVLDGHHPALKRNKSGTVDNTLHLLDIHEDLLDAAIRDVLNQIGVY